MNCIEAATFELAANDFESHKKTANYDELVDNMLENFEKIRKHMNIKLHYLHSHLDKIRWKFWWYKWRRSWNNINGTKVSMQMALAYDGRLMLELYLWSSWGSALKKIIQLHGKLGINDGVIFLYEF